MRKIQRPAPEQSRERTLTDEELAAIWRACEEVGYPYNQIVRLLIVTMQRRNEVVGSCWSEIDLDQGLWTIPSVRTKTNRAHTLPLSTCAVAIISSVPKIDDHFLFPARGNNERTFSGFAKLKRRLDTASGVSAWTLHDPCAAPVRRRWRALTLHLTSSSAFSITKLERSAVSPAYITGLNTCRDMRRALSIWAEFVVALG